MTLHPVRRGQIRVDGDLGEWRGAPFIHLGESDDSALEYALGYDADALYVAARVFDDSFVRTRRPSSREDAVVLTLAMPRAGGRPRVTEVWLFAGVMGEQAATAALGKPGARPRPDGAVKIVEGPLPGDEAGVVVEARIPWARVPGGAEFQIARGAIRLHDVDRKVGARASTVASAELERGRPDSLPALKVEGGAGAALSAFMKHQGIGWGAVRRDLVGNVAGDGRLERVIVAKTFAVIVGPDIQGGTGFHYLDLPVTSAAGVRDARLQDLTGDGRAELVLELQQQNERGRRRLLEVMDVSSPQARKLFALELSKETPDGRVEVDVRIGKAGRGKPPAIDVRIGSARGLDASNFHEGRSADAESILLPWGPVARRVYRWDGQRFGVEREEENPDAADPESQPTPPAPGGGSAPAGPRRTATHAAPPGTDALIAAFRQAQGIDPSARPRFVRHVNVAEDGRHESLMLFGAHLLVVGNGYRGGSGYFYFRLPAKEPDDIQRLFTGDVTGDGRREVFIRFKQMVDDVQREILVGYTFDSSGAMQPILATEVRRARGDDAIGNIVDLVPHRGHWALRIAPGRPRGWDARSYPFVTESSDGYGPLLLPWNDSATTFRWDGTRLARD
ncbi:MAG: hypothetical protein PVI30_15980 [Myxococcales bacterium]